MKRLYNPAGRCLEHGLKRCEACDARARRFSFKYNDAGKPVKLRERVGADCTVRALAIASGISYAGALTLCQRAGFEHGQGMDGRAYNVVLMRFGFEYHEATPGDRLDEVTGTGIADIPGHVVAVVDGRVNDIFDTLKAPAAETLLGVWRRVITCETK